MRRTHALFAFALVASLAACGQGSKKSGPAVAKGDGIVITADEFKARLDEQSPFIRARYNTLERKKEFLDNLIRFELLAKAAEKQGLDKDPEVQLTLRKVMVQKLVQKTFSGEGDAAKEIPEAEARKFYDDHKDDYVKPRKVRLAQILVAAPEGPARAQKAAQAKKLLARVQAEEKKNALAFPALARELSEDAATKGTGGDLGFKSQVELEKQYGKPFADEAFTLKGGANVLLESPQGFHVVKLTAAQEGIERPFEMVKPQIQTRLYRERRTKDFDEFVKKLREEARVTVDDAELEKVTVAAAPPGQPGLPHGMMPPGAMSPGMPPPGAQPGARVVPAPPPGAAAPAPPAQVRPAPSPGQAQPVPSPAPASPPPAPPK
ncbi:MAG TPA: peptidyl-prolyl cis-trans isomerase [Anaeromyxobacteraceae bacterium]|nr:peptidyl-prolyl cis-trans isomerase [Anaeromyxobacteraceae bacterium]